MLADIIFLCLTGGQEDGAGSNQKPGTKKE